MMCGAELHLGDSHGDGVVTFRCKLEAAHEGPHRETFDRSGKPVEITWHTDERPCGSCDGTGICWPAAYSDLTRWEKVQRWQDQQGADEPPPCSSCNGTGERGGT